VSGEKGVNVAAYGCRTAHLAFPNYERLPFFFQVMHVTVSRRAVAASSDVARISTWRAGDLILAAESQSVASDASLTIIGTWQTVNADFSGVGRRFSVVNLEFPEFGAPRVEIDNGATLTVFFADDVKVFDWANSDPVMLVDPQ